MAPAFRSTPAAILPRSPRLRPRSFCAALLLIAALASSIGPDDRAPADLLIPPGRSLTAPDPAADRLRRQRERQMFWAEHVLPRLAAVDVRTQLAAEHSLQAVRLWLADQKVGSEPFAESALNLRSKWHLARSKMPARLGGDPNAHRDYLNRQFADHVFSGDEFRQAIEAAAAGYADQLQAAENDLLVAVRADLDDWPLNDLPALRSVLLAHGEFERVLREVAPAVARDLGLDCVCEVTSFAVSEIATVVVTAAVTRLGISAGILAAGAGTSWATLGVSVVAALALDQVVGLVIDYVRDPTGQLARRIDTLLDDVSESIIEGEPAGPGLRIVLTDFDATRSRLRYEALRRLVLATGDSEHDTGESEHDTNQSLTAVVYGE